MKKSGLSYKDKIKSKKDFDLIYSNGKIVFSDDNVIKAVYISEKDSENPGVKTAAAVSRKSGKAVWRNRIKRLIREAYRLNKVILSDLCTSKNISLKVVFSVYSINENRMRIVKLSDVLPGVTGVMLKIKNTL